MTNTQHSLPLEVLGGISAEHFLTHYWQKKPLLIRQAFPGFQCPLDPDDLAGLALEDAVESRIIIEQGETSAWQLQSGPFEAQAFSQLPQSHWTLLIQQLDAWDEDINALKQHFNFIPNWRIDDIMASYAPVGGSVGPHYDQYDVFLLQAQGQRRWQLGQMCDEQSPRVAGTPLNILSEFHAETEWDWVLEPGDMLYLPPLLAHHGVAQNDCITLSVGFRAPTQKQLLNSFVDHINTQDLAEVFYQDPELQVSSSPGKVDTLTRDKVRKLMRQALDDNEFFERWFVEFSSEAKNVESLGEPNPEFSSTDLSAIIEAGLTLQQSEGSRFIYICNKKEVVLAVDGFSYSLALSYEPFVKVLCEQSSIPTELLRDMEHKTEVFELVVALIRQGSLYC